MKVVLDTCVLKLATFPAEDNPSALVVALGLRRILRWWTTPAILDEYSSVMADAPDLLAEVFAASEVCYPLTELSIVRHEPDNRFIECALAVQADYLITVNTVPGHFEKKQYGKTRVMPPGLFVSMDCVQPLLRRLKSA